MRSKNIILTLLLIIPVAILNATTISLPGSYEISPADIIVLDEARPDRTIVYNLENLLGNQIDYSVRYGNLNAMNVEFGDIPESGSFGLFIDDELILAEDGILEAIFGESEISVGEMVDDNGRLRLRLRLLEDSDPLVFYRSWLYVTDDIIPGTTEDLEVTRTMPTTLKLNWTAAGDDGIEGMAAMYEIRYSKWPVENMEEWWGFAEQAADLPYPGEPESEETYWASDLDTVSAYYFVLVTYDELGNRSEFSNIASGVTGEDSGPEPGENYCLEFNGENTRAVVPFQQILNPSESITVEAWVYPYELEGASQRMVFDKPYYSWQYPFYQYNMAVNDEGTFYAAVLTGDDLHIMEHGNYSVPLNDWTHLAWTYDGSSFTTYVNGQFNQSSEAFGLIPGFETDLTIGIRGGVQHGFFNGLIDEIRIWNIARTGEEINYYKNRHLNGNEDGLIAYWNFDEGAGQWFYDGTEYGSHGYLGFEPDPEDIDPIWVESDSPIEYLRTDTDDELITELPKMFALGQNYPNPFNAETKISFSLPKAADINLAIYDMLGRRVRNLVSGFLEAGSYDYSWDGKTDSGEILSSGVYFYRLSAENFDQSKKMLLLK